MHNSIQHMWNPALCSAWDGGLGLYRLGKPQALNQQAFHFTRETNKQWNGYETMYDSTRLNSYISAKYKILGGAVRIHKTKESFVSGFLRKKI